MSLPAILLNFGGESVAGAVVVFSDDQAPKIIYSHEVFYPAERMVHAREKISLDLFKKATAEVLAKLEKDGLSKLVHSPATSLVDHLQSHRIKQIHCTFASPWFLSQTRIIRIEKKQPFTITDKILKKLIEDEAQSFLNENGLTHESKEIIETKLISTKLNGYETAVPQGKKARDLEVAVYISIVSKNVKHQVQAQVSSAFVGVPISFHSFPVATFGLVRDIPQAPQHFLLIDVDGFVTDITIIKNGVALQTITVPYGANQFLKAIMKDQHSSFEMALSTLSLQGMGTLVNTTKKVIKSPLDEAQKKWQGAISEAVGLLSEECFIPGVIYLTADGRLQNFFAHLLLSQSFGREASDGSSFKVQVLDRAFLKTILNSDDASTRSDNLIISTLFINKLVKN